MIDVLNDMNFAKADEFVEALNKERLKYKNKWITYSGVVAGKTIAMKTFGCGYLQIFRVNGIDYGGSMDMKVGEWKAIIVEAINS